MRVLLVAHRFPPDGVAGVERITQTLAAELTAAGDSVSIISGRPAPLDSLPVRERLADGTAVYRFPILEPRPRTAFLLNHDYLEQRFVQTCIEAQPEVVHFMHLIDLSPRFVRLARRYSPVVLSLQDFYLACHRYTLQKVSGALCDGPNGGRECAAACFADEGSAALPRWTARTLYFRRVLHMAERLIAPSRFVADFFEGFGVDADRLRVVPNGVSIPPLEYADGRRTPQSRGAFNIAFLGQVMVHKGPHFILDALRLADLGAVELSLIGIAPDIEYARQLRARADAIPGLRLRLFGPYEPSQLPYLLADVDCVVTPSRWPETFAIVTREALRRGVPPLVSRLGALPEAVVEGENGYTFDPQRPHDLAVHLQRLATDEALLHKLREGARRTPVTTVGEHATAVRAVYEEAYAEYMRAPRGNRTVQEEFDALHAVLIQHGFAENRDTLAPSLGAS